MSYTCIECDKAFRSVAGFDAHRTGEHGVNQGSNRRRCMTDAEMRAIGFVLTNGKWSRPLSENAISRLRVRRIRHENDSTATPLPPPIETALRAPMLSFIMRVH